MYDIAKKARAGMKSKAERLAGEKDRKVDSSDWTPAEPLNADVKTGMRPVSRRAYKKGGAVKGEVGKQRADRAPRKAGGKVEEKGEQPLVDRYINRDLKKANEYRDGKKHVGALKHGGRAHKADGGSMTMEEMIKKNPAPKKDEGFKAPNPVPLPPRRKPEPVPPRDYEKADPRLIKACSGGRMKKNDGGGVDPRLGMVKPKALEFGQNVVTPGLKSGGRTKKQIGGAMMGTPAMAAGPAAMQALSAPVSIPSLPPVRPMPTVGSGLLPQAPVPANPIVRPPVIVPPAPTPAPATGGAAARRGARAAAPAPAPAPVTSRRRGAQGAKEGGRTEKAFGGSLSGYADGGKAKGKSKGKTNINIIIATGKPSEPEQPQMAPMGAGAPPPPPPAPMMGAGAPPPMGGPAMPPMGQPPAPAMPPMPRKAGGRVSKVAHSYKDMTAGSGSGEGRLQKTDIAKRSAHKAGGKVYRSYKDMDAGAGSGEGRLEKTEIQSRKK